MLHGYIPFHRFLPYPGTTSPSIEIGESIYRPGFRKRRLTNDHVGQPLVLEL